MTQPGPFSGGKVEVIDSPTRKPATRSATREKRDAAEASAPGKIDLKHCGDRALVEACLAGGEDAWEELVCRYGSLVFSIPRHYGLDRDVCEDIFQEVFSILVGQLSRIRSQTGLPKWFITTTHRVCCQWFKRSQRTATTELPVLDGPAPPTEHIMRLERHQLVRQALRRLGGRCEELLLALYSNQGTDRYEQVARQLRIPVGSIGPTRARCLQKLMEILAAMEAEEPS